MKRRGVAWIAIPVQKQFAKMPSAVTYRVREPRMGSDDRPNGSHPAVAAIERGAAIVAGGIITFGPFFWAALAVAYLAASFGFIR